MANLEDLRIDQPVPKPRRRRPSYWPWVIAAAAVLGWLGWHGKLKLPAAAGLKTALAGATEVEVFTVPSEAAGPAGAISAGGYLEVIPPGPTVVSSLVAGKLESVLAVPGQAVKAGELLARLDSTLQRQEAAVLASDVKLAESRLKLKQAGFRTEEISQAESAVASSQARLSKAEADLTRMQELFGKGVISKSELERFETERSQAQSEVQSRQAQLDLLRSGNRPEDLGIAEAEVAAAKARLAEINARIAACEVHAPIDGVVYEQLAQAGDWLAPTEGEKLSAAVLSIFDPHLIQAYVDVNQRDSEKITVGQAVTVTTDALPSRPLHGTVRSVMPRANLQKNTVQVKIRLDETPADLRPELSVKVSFLPPETPDQQAPAQVGIPLPVGSTVVTGSGTGVFVVEGDVARWRTIEVQAVVDIDQVIAVSGLGPGDQVILSPAGLSDGQKIKIKSAEAAKK